MAKYQVPSVADIKKRIAERNERKESFKKSVDPNFFPFWEMEDGEHCTVRLLPDANLENEYLYYIPAMEHRLDIDGKEYKFTCPRTHDAANDCPVCDRSQAYYKDGDKENGKKYWRELFGYVRIMPLKYPFTVEDDDGEEVDYTGRVCKSRFGYQILQALENEISDLDEDVDPAPWGIEDGFNFDIKKTPNGKWSSYSFSKFHKRPSGIPEEFRDNIELIDFRDMLPQQPSLEKIQHFLDAHDGVVELDLDQFKEGGGDSSKSSESKPKPKPKAEKKPKASKPKRDVSTDDNVTVLSNSDDDDDEDMDLINDIINRNRSV